MMNIKRFYKKMNIIIKVINYENIHIIYTKLNIPIKKFLIYFLIYTQLKYLIGGYNVGINITTHYKYPLNTF